MASIHIGSGERSLRPVKIGGSLVNGVDQEFSFIFFTEK